MLSLRLLFSVSILALSVTFGDSSPKGRAIGKEGRLYGMQKPLPLGEVAAEQPERASPFSKRIHTAISRFFDRAMLSLRLFLSVSVLALSVTFGDSSPRGGASGVSVRPTRDEQSTMSRER